MVMERFRFRKSDQEGFTLIEMAIVLVVIGLILGMVFKGRQLIAGAKVKNAIASYNKTIAGVNTYYDRYGMYPGDGCVADDPEPVDCRNQAANPPNGLIASGTGGNANEPVAFWYLLTEHTRILSASDRESALGNRWEVEGDTNSTWVYATGADKRIVCDMNRLADDGRSDTGDIRSEVDGDGTDFTGDSSATAGDGYNAENHDCWALTGITTVKLRILP